MKSAFHFLYLLQKLIFLIVIFSLVLEKTISSDAHAQNLNIVATIKPIHSLVSMVTENLESPTLLVKGAASPHTYALKPSDAKILNSANIIFRVSDSIEPFLAKSLSSLPPSIKVVTLSETQGLTLLKYRSGETFEPDLHDSDKLNHDHKEEHIHNTDKIGHTQIDGHIWLDPENAILLTKEINKILKEISPVNAPLFEKNTAQAISDIQKVSLRISNVLIPIRGKPYVVFHDALYYFENRFRFPAIGSITVSPELQTSGKRLTQIRDRLKKLKASCVFSEPNSNPKMIETILEGTSAQVGSLDPEGLLVNPGPSAYADILNGLADSLASCLK